MDEKPFPWLALGGTLLGLVGGVMLGRTWLAPAPSLPASTPSTAAPGLPAPALPPGLMPGVPNVVMPPAPTLTTLQQLAAQQVAGLQGVGMAAPGSGDGMTNQQLTDKSGIAAVPGQAVRQPSAMTLRTLLESQGVSPARLAQWLTSLGITADDQQRLFAQVTASQQSSLALARWPLARLSQLRAQGQSDQQLLAAMMIDGVNAEMAQAAVGLASGVPPYMVGNAPAQPGLQIATQLGALGTQQYLT